MLAPLPVSSAISGGLMIGLAAALLLLLSGRIAGISGMAAIATGLDRRPARRAEAIAFIAGLPLGALAIAALVRTPDIEIAESPLLLAVGGLLVGFGARLGNGCTSGHGVCGTARLSARSLAATGLFMVSAIATVWVVRHGIGG